MPATQTRAKLWASTAMEMLSDTFAGVDIVNRLFAKRAFVHVLLLATY